MSKKLENLVCNMLTHSLGAATEINIALAHTEHAEVKRALLDAMHSALIVAEQARQYFLEPPTPRAGGRDDG